MHQLRRALGLLLVTPSLVAACAVAPGGQPPVAPIAVRTMTVAPTTIAGTVVYSGNAEANARVNVLPKITGQITVLNVDVGSRVKKGDVLAELDHATLDTQVAQAQAALTAAQAKLATILAGPRPETVAQARANLKAAQETLAMMQQGGRAEAIQVAQGNYDSAVARLTGLQKGRDEQIAQARANLEAAQARLDALKKGPTPEKIRVAQLAVDQAKNAAFAADVQKDAACNPVNPRTMCKAAEAAADAAHTAVDQAQAQLAALLAPPTPEQLREAQAAVDAARAQLQIAQQPGSPSDLATAQGAVAAAKAQLDLAKAPYTAADLAKAQAAVDVAAQQLKLAEQPYTKHDEEAARAAVQQAQAALEMATVTRDQAIIRAPIDGVVAQKLLAVGALAAPTTPIVTLIDPGVDVVVAVDPRIAATLQVDQSATITSDALPGTAIPATIALIAPAVDPQSRTIAVKVVPRDSPAGLKDGMLVQVALVTATHRGVIAVPSDAIVQRNGQPTVYVVANGVATPRAVQTGLTDGTRTEITQGLTAGEVVVVSGQDQLTGAQPVTIQQ